jgi:hypothetical protein
MSGVRWFFLVFSALIALVGLFAAAASTDYLQVFGLGLMLFGVLFAHGCVKRHFDEQEAAARG